MFTREYIINYLVDDGYNAKLIKALSNKELYRIFILALAFNSTLLK